MIKKGAESMASQTPIEQDKLREITDMIKELKFGEIHIKIHEGKIVQINRLDKRRFTV